MFYYVEIVMHHSTFDTANLLKKMLKIFFALLILLHLQTQRMGNDQPIDTP